MFNDVSECVMLVGRHVPIIAVVTINHIAMGSRLCLQVDNMSTG